MRGWPRSGVPRAMRDYTDFVERTELLVRAADVPDYTWFWWKLRPHPRLGTVEVRALDAQSSLSDTLRARRARRTAWRASRATAPPEPDPPAEMLEEGMFRAARFGVARTAARRDGRLRPVSRAAREALALAREHAAELGCEAELGELAELLERGGGAGRQRVVYEIAGMDALLRELLELTRPPGA